VIIVEGCFITNTNRPIAVIVLLIASQLLACRLAALLPTATPTATATKTRTPPVARLVAPPVVEPTTTPVPQPVRATVTENLRVRSAPSTTAAILGRLNKGDTVQIVGRTAANDWWQILLPTNPNARGWIAAQFTEVSGPVDAVPIVQPPRPPTPPAYPYP